MTAFLLVPLLTVAAAVLGFALDSPWLLPLLTAAPGYAALVMTLRRATRGRAVLMMLWWAGWLALSMILLTLSRPDRAESVIFHGAAYRDEMFRWLTTGEGRESSPALFLPQHIVHASVFSALALLTGSALAVLMGAVLMNYMSFYVGALIAECAGSPAQAAATFLAWNPWSMVRVASFIVLGVVLAEPLLARLGILRKGSPPPGSRTGWILAAAGGLLLDIVLKTLLAPSWPSLLRECFSPASASIVPLIGI